MSKSNKSNRKRKYDQMSNAIQIRIGDETNTEDNGDNDDSEDNDDDLKSSDSVMKRRKLHHSEKPTHPQALTNVISSENQHDVILCDECNLEYNMNQINMTFEKSKFIDKWFCDNCVENNGSKITYKCDINQCPANKKSWLRMSTLHKHYIDHMHHNDHINSNYLKCFNYKKCNTINCNKLLALSYVQMECADCIANTNYNNFINQQNPLINESLLPGREVLDQNEEKIDVINQPIPHFIQIFKSNIKCLEFIPKALMKSVINTFCYLLNQVVKYNNLKAWTELSLFARVALCKNKRGGKAHKIRNNNTLRNKLKRIRNGEIVQLWHEMKNEIESQPHAHINKNMQQMPQRLQRKVSKLISRGETKNL